MADNKIEDSLTDAIGRSILTNESPLPPSPNHWYYHCCKVSGIWTFLWWSSSQILRQLLTACWNAIFNVLAVPCFHKLSLSFLLKMLLKIPLSKKLLIKSKMFSMFLLLKVICIFVLHQLFRLNTGHWTIKNLKKIIERITCLEDRTWKKHYFFLNSWSFLCIRLCPCKLSLTS